MRAKEYLRKVRDLDKECSAILSRIEELHADITRTTAILSDMPRGGKQDRHEEVLTEMIDLKCRFRTDLLELMRLKGEAIGLINSLADSRYRLVLNHYYLGGMTWEQVAVTMDISYRWVLKLHGQALKKFQKKLEKLHCSSL